MTSTGDLFLSAEWKEYLERNRIVPVWHCGLLVQRAESTTEHAHRTSIRPILLTRMREEELYLELSREISKGDVPLGYGDFGHIWKAMNGIMMRRDRVTIFRHRCNKTYQDPQTRPVNLPGGSHPLLVATNLTKTKFYLDRRPGDPIFSYSHQENPNDIGDCFKYQGNVPYPMTYERVHLRVSAIKVFNILSVFLWFHASGPKVLGIPACQDLATVDSFMEDDMARLYKNWQSAERLRHLPSNYKTLLHERSEFQEFVALLFRLDRSDCDESRQLVQSMEPLTSILGSLERPHGDTQGPAAGAFRRLAPVLLRYVERHFENETNRARARLFKHHVYNGVLVYDRSCFANRPAVRGKPYSIFDHYRQCNGLYINGEAVFGWDVKLDTPLESFTRHASGTSAARNRVFRLVHSRTLEEQPFGPFSQPVAAFGNPEIDNDNCYRGFRDAAATILRDRIAHTVDPSHLLEPTPTPNHVEEATGQPLRSLFLSIDQYPDLSLESDTFSSALN